LKLVATSLTIYDFKFYKILIFTFILTVVDTVGITFDFIFVKSRNSGLDGVAEDDFEGLEKGFWLF
jgi:hypothetical protein